MLTFKNAVKTLVAALSLGIAASVYAEAAPVYDADSMQTQQDYGMSDQAQYYPPPPQNQDSGSGFISVQPTISSAAPETPLSVEQRIQKVEQQVTNMQTGDSANRVESLQNQVQTLRGQVEQLTHQLEQLQTQQKSMYSDLDTRLTKTGDKPANPVNPAPASDTTTVASNADTQTQTQTQPTADDTIAVSSSKASKASKQIAQKLAKTVASQPNVAEEQQIYQTAYNLIKAKKYSEAVNALQGMLKKYPSGQFASNAHYWLGELYGLMGKNDQALVEFTTVVETYPDSPRVSDAQLKVGLLFASQSKWSDAKAALKKVINHYPGSASARMATEQLKQIKIAGH